MNQWAGWDPVNLLESATRHRLRTELLRLVQLLADVIYPLNEVVSPFRLLLTAQPEFQSFD